jgi:hydroxypyruvate reductase
VSARHTLLELFDAALRAVNGRACVERILRGTRLTAPVEVFAIGKAAASMALGARDALGDAIRQMLVITKDGHSDPGLEVSGVMQVEGPHPMPGERSLELGALLETRVRGLPADRFPLFLVSGGSSSLVEELRDGASLDDLRELNARGLAAGWDIGKLNGERARLSRIKGGGIARLLGGRPALALFMSDVPDDDPEVIGSGLLGRGGEGDHVRREVVAAIPMALDAVREAAAARGLQIETRAARFDGDAATVAREFVEALRDSAADGLAWGGESIVVLPARHGRGGRNTHLALAAARLLRPGDPLTILAAGTDGTDGPTDDAGALVDAGPVERAELGGCDVERAFRDFDSGTALEAAGDLVHTGPTGANVGDILIGIKRAPAARGPRAARVL